MVVLLGCLCLFLFVHYLALEFYSWLPERSIHEETRFSYARKILENERAVLESLRVYFLMVMVENIAPMFSTKGMLPHTWAAYLHIKKFSVKLANC